MRRRKTFLCLVKLIRRLRASITIAAAALKCTKLISQAIKMGVNSFEYKGRGLGKEKNTETMSELKRLTGGNTRSTNNKSVLQS